MNRAIADRNLMTHQGGIVDGEYLKQSGRTDVKLGDAVSLDGATVRWGLSVVEFTAAKVAHAIAAKFDFDVTPTGSRRPVPVPSVPAV